MSSAQAMQEELQQSVVLSEGEAEYGEDDRDNMEVDDTHTGDNETRGDSSANGRRRQPRASRTSRNDTDEEFQDALDDQSAGEEDADSDLSEANDDDPNQSSDDGNGDESGDDEDKEDASMGEADAEGDDDDEPITQTQLSQDDEHDVEDEDDAEGVGAVKIRPGDTDEESDESASIASGASSDHDSEAEWEAAAENGNEDEDEESEAADLSLCLFCKKPEENDPSEDFESFLACSSCGDHAHQQCARDASAISEQNAPSKWKCPECAEDDTSSSSEHGEDAQDVLQSQEVDEDGEDNHPSAHGETRKRGQGQAESRVLRKRKSSEGAVEEDSMALRKRHRSTPDGSNHEGGQEESMNDDASSVRPRSVRSVRLKSAGITTPCTVIKRSRSSLVLNMRVKSEELSKILSRKPKPLKKRSHRAATSRPAQTNGTQRDVPVADALAVSSVFGPSYSQPFYSFYDKETDELKGKPYGGILTEQEADTTKTLPTKDDRRRFDEAKQKAEEEWRNRLLAMQAEAEMQPVRKTKKAQGPASQIECIEFGGWEIDTWYAAPYPEEYSRNRVLYICEFCLKYMNSDYVAWRHKLKCPAKHPPGDEIYRHGSISFFEVDGRKNPVYCQNLCLLAKLFLGSKTLYYDVEPFLFYVLCEYDDLGYHFVGYFSKEKRASSQNNVSCILTLPIHQRKGYGNLLIDFSYLLTKVEEKTGSPEKPLSDMGLVSYRNYWRLVMCQYLLDNASEDRMARKGLSIRQISDDTGMVPDDVVSALEGLRCLVRDPISGLYAFRVDFAYCRQYVEKWDSKGYVKLKPNALTWTPYVMGRSNATNFELGPTISTIAPRDEDDDIKTPAVNILASSGIATGDFALHLGPDRKVVTALEPGVLESTEPNDNTELNPENSSGVNGTDTTVNENEENSRRGPNSSGATSEEKQDVSWDKAYEDIPTHRFVVFPPVNPRRPTVPRISSSIVRPTLPRAPSSASRPRPRPRRPSGATPRPRKSSSTQRKSSSSSKRKSGGTGRGPGRWPKGTKKSDYGNADSGPGLPPAWLERQRQLKSDGETSADAGAHDTVNVQTPDAAAGNAGVHTISARFELKPDSAAEDDDDEDDDEDEDDRIDLVVSDVHVDNGDDDLDAEGEEE
ncbi:uncharacterized protein B0I36DRAFT_333442 [Microdochium trichocladiopsis]|uniref:Histone acetyltransferase n=1 Tax=Microdochium trichocladiopsis TaxID=1682393 RepID=A0A9P8XX13_9PEZI|nr:uncharacterized protein B0I36DRAFT_333442 [Microdochium trichocladiopsis]KAH7020927.1 hypothetical protein B0I36DRAFT_333442 [Microdochium trichocladiopsis]